MEILHSDEGQLAWMKGYAHGVQQADLESRGVIPADLKAKLPASSAFASAVAPSPDQLSRCSGVDQSRMDVDRWCGLSRYTRSNPINDYVSFRC